MKTELRDNFFNEDFADYLHHVFKYEAPHQYGHTSIDGSVPFYVCNFPLEHPLINYIIYKIRKNFLKSFTPLRAYINVQHQGMEGSFHADDGDVTCLYMASETLGDGNGEFIVKNEKNYSFKKNRLILFDAKKEHKGCAPNDNSVRITLAIKMEKNETNN